MINLFKKLFKNSKIEKSEEKQEVKPIYSEKPVPAKPEPAANVAIKDEKKETVWFYPKTEFIKDPDGGKELLKTKDNKPIGIVIHHSASYSLNSTVRYAIKNVIDAHFFIGHSGKVIQTVECNRTASHAGISKWNGKDNLNNYYIGIEVINIGWLKKKGDKYIDGYGKEWTGAVRQRSILGYRYWEPFTVKQEEELLNLCSWLVKEYGIPIENIAAHFEVSPGRKNDPAGGLSKSMAEFRKSVELKVKGL